MRKFNLLAGVVLLVVAVGLIGYSIYAIQEREQLLNNNNLTFEERSAYEGSLLWWQNNYNNLFLPISILLVALGVVALLYPQLLELLNQKPEQKLVTPNNSKNRLIDTFLLRVIEEKKPETIERLTYLAQQNFDYSKEEIISRIIVLQKNGKIAYQKTPAATITFSRFFLSGKANWYWLTLLFAISATAIIMEVPENSYPLVYARYAFGYIFALFFPGYAFMKAIFPASLDVAERIGLSIGVSIALVALDAFFLNFSPSGIEFTKLVMSLLAIILVFATIGLIRDIRIKLNSH